MKAAVVLSAPRRLQKREPRSFYLIAKVNEHITFLSSCKSQFPDGNFDAISCDLQNFSSVRSGAESIKSRYSVIDVLVNNAGVMALKGQATTDGYDVQM